MTFYEAKQNCVEARRLGWKATLEGCTDYAMTLISPGGEEHTFYHHVEWLRLKTALAEEVERKRTP